MMRSAWPSSWNPPRQVNNLGSANMALQTILVAEKLLFAKRHKAARTNDAVIKADRVKAKTQLTATIAAFLGFFFLVLHDAMK
ncbi:MAG: hypothetical protein IH987_05360 [Planctomycetes bacterium]|nr:hypothetical protein [Planctomycetota bacterium]